VELNTPPIYPDLFTFCTNVDMKMYDLFLILTAGRFTYDEFELINKIKIMRKSFFLIRTKIDIDKDCEKRKRGHDVEEMVTEIIRGYLYENVKEFGISEDEIFLISNWYRDRWDFCRLVDAILEQLPFHRREALTLSLTDILSAGNLKRKVEVYKCLPFTLINLI
jgi:hypothetical protein